MGPGTCRVGLVENEEAYRDVFVQQLSGVPNVRSLRVWNSSEEFLREAAPAPLDILFLDIGLPHMNGVELAGIVHRDQPETSIIMLTNLMSEELIFKAIKNGAIGYILKSELRNFGEVIEIVQNGGAVITPTIALRVMTSLKGDASVSETELTTREHQILNELVSGATTVDAAKTLGISENTARTHVKNIYRKLQVSSRVELMRKAIDLGLA